jgi:hypothetical protein
VLEAIEDLIIDSMLDGFTCWCGDRFEKTTGTTFGATLKAHFTEYCELFKLLREQALKLEPIDGE